MPAEFEDVVASNINDILDELRAMKSRVIKLENQALPDITKSPAFAGVNKAYMQTINYPVMITSVNAPNRQCVGMRVISTGNSVLVSPNTNLSDKPLTIDIPSNGSLPNLNDVVLATYLGNYGYGATAVGKYILADSGERIGGVNIQPGPTYTIDPTDRGKLVIFSNINTFTVTFPNPASVTAIDSFWFCDLENGNQGVAVLTPATSTAIDGLQFILLNQSQGVRIFCDGTNYYTQRGRSAPSVQVNTISSYTVQVDDFYKLLSFTNTNTVAISLQTPASVGISNGWWVEVEYAGNAGALLSAPTSITIDNSLTVNIGSNQGCRIFSDGTNYYTQRGISSVSSLYYQTISTSLSTLTRRPTLDFESGTGAVVTVTDTTGGGGRTVVTISATTTNLAGGVNLQTATYTVVAGDKSKLITFNGSNSSAILTPAGLTGIDSLWYVDIENRHTTVVTIFPNTSTIDGTLGLVLNQNQGVRVFSDNSNYYTQRGMGTASVSSPAGGVNIQTASYTLVAGDKSKLITFNNSGCTAMMPVAGTTNVDSFWYVDIENRNTAVVTITTTPTQQIDNLYSAIVLQKDQGVRLFCDNQTYYTQRGMGTAATSLYYQTISSSVSTYTQRPTLDFEAGPCTLLTVADTTGGGGRTVVTYTDGTGGVNAKTATYTIVAGDRSKLVTFNGTQCTAALYQAGTTGIDSFWYVDIENRNTAVVTISPLTSTIDGTVGLVLPQNQGVRIFSDNSNYYTQRGMCSIGSIYYQTISSSISTFTQRPTLDFEAGTGLGLTVVDTTGGGGRTVVTYTGSYTSVSTTYTVVTSVYCSGSTLNVVVSTITVVTTLLSGS